MKKYKYQLFDFPNKTISAKRFSLELGGAGFNVENLNSILKNESDVTFTFETDLDPSEEVLLDAVISLHSGVVIPNVTILGSQSIFKDSVAITTTTEWQPLGSQLLRPTKMYPNLDEIISQVFGEVMCEGTCEIRIVEIKGDGSRTVLHADPIQLQDTKKEWVFFDGFSNVRLTDGFNRYEIQARINTGIKLSIRYLSAALLRVF